MMDVWIVAVVTDGPQGGKPEATLFFAACADRDAAEAAVLAQVAAPHHTVTAAPIPEAAALELNMKDGEVRQLAR